jgi:hypothetical protein
MFQVSIQLTDSLKNLLKETAKQLKGAVKCKFLAQTVSSTDRTLFSDGGGLTSTVCF